MNWAAAYNEQICTADEAVRRVQSGQRIFLSGNCSVPQRLLAALVDSAQEVEDVEICHSLAVAPPDYVRPEMQGHLRVNSLFISANVRKAVAEGRADFTPVMLSELPLLFKRGLLPVDAAFVHLSPPDGEGYCTFGIESGLTRTAALSARQIIAEVNAQMPRTLGDTCIHVSQLAAIVPVDYPPAEYCPEAEGDREVIEKIAGFVSERIPDGATLQLGIGAIPGAILGHLYEKRDLGIHTELFSDGLIDLVEAGVVNGVNKTLHPGKIVAGFMIGTQRLYRWVDGNPAVELHPTEYVNNPFVIAQNAKMVAINSAIEIDLTGQVCADSIGTRLYSGVGGQLDFIYGASLSEGGLPVIALPSTTRLSDGTLISRIVATLKPGAGVDTPRSQVHYVATEYGMVDLYGKSIRQRAHALISIAHPAFREELEHEAQALHYI
jgi:acetyl-CoA hydrolase